jgi:hypothetical protein
MPYYVPPATPEDRLFVLDETAKYVADEQTAGRPSPIKAATLSGITAFADVYRPLVGALTGALGNRAREVSEATTTKDFLEEVARDYLEVLKRRARRKRHNVEVLVFHGLPENGDIPPLNSWSDLKQAVDKIITGHGLSVATYGAMTNPELVEIQDALAGAQEQHEDVAPADSAVQAAQTALEAKDEPIDYWVSEIRYDALDFARRENDAGQRRLLRKLGFKFKTLAGETSEDPGDQPTPTSPTP